MAIPILVHDLEFLARISLKGLDEPGYKRVAYFAGMYFGLRVAQVYAQIEVADPDPCFWEMLEGRQLPRPNSIELVTCLARYTSPRFNFVLSWVREPGLRYGPTGNYYALGTKDAVQVAIKQVPAQFKFLRGSDWKKPTLNWIEDKIIWAGSRLDNEKHFRIFK